jgi:hypothetical protein
MKSAGKLVAGPVMTHYVTLQVTEDLAGEASGEGAASGTVAATGGNTYQSCDTQGGGCQSFTAFTADPAGQITGMSVDGRTIASGSPQAPQPAGAGSRSPTSTATCSRRSARPA